MSPSQNFATISEAFSRTADNYDAFAQDHPNQTRMRRKACAHLMRYLEQSGRILELNAGTGIDAVYLAQQGFYLHATDIAPGMLRRLRDKVQTLNLGDRVTAQVCSFTDLDQITGGPYDAVFSNLGGLNCIPDLSPVIDGLSHVLRPGGLVTWVLMPPICLWELAMMFTGRFRLAFRRLQPGGTRAHLEGLYFTIYYCSPRQVAKAFGPDYRLLAIEGLSVITPPAESKNLAKRHPSLFNTLAWLDDRLSPRWPWWGWGDFFIITLRYQPRKKYPP